MEMTTGSSSELFTMELSSPAPPRHFLPRKRSRLSQTPLRSLPPLSALSIARRMNVPATAALDVSIDHIHINLPADSSLVFPCRELVNCEDCADFDLCLVCFTNGDHGHDPSHTFDEAVKYSLDAGVRALCAPGRGVRHEAVCDGCDNVCLIFNQIDFTTSANDCSGHPRSALQVPNLSRL